jgi:beta-lactamase regulating signal transducer with metallopeptidase domain
MAGILEVLAQNALVAGALAALATLVLAVLGRPAVAHALFLIALAKLVTPVWVGLPLLESAIEADRVGPDELLWNVPAGTAPDLAAEIPPRLAAVAAVPADGVPVGDLLTVLWIAGMVSVTLLAVRRRRRFAVLLSRADRAPAGVRGLAGGLAARLGLRRVPDLRVVDARIAPMVFAHRGGATVLLPRVAVEALDEAELSGVLAHELAHLANRDHWTRRLEALVAIVHWWNPIAWWLRRGLRDCEELRCDARAITVLDRGARHYGRSILKTVSYVDGDLSGLPLAVSALGGPGSLKKRLTMIAENKIEDRLSRLGRATLALSAAALLPLGLTAQDPGAKDASRAAKIEQIRALLQELKKEVQTESGAGQAAAEKAEKAGSTKAEAAPDRPQVRILRGDGEERRVFVIGGEGRAGTLEGGGGDGGPVEVRVLRQVDEDGAVREVLRHEVRRVTDRAERHEHGHEQEVPAKWIEVRIGEDGQPARIEVDGKQIDGGHMAIVLRQGKGMPFLVWKSGDGAAEGAEVDVDVEGLEDLPTFLRSAEAKAEGAAPQARAFVFPGQVGGLAELPAEIRSLVEASTKAAGAAAITLRGHPGEEVEVVEKKAARAEDDTEALRDQLQKLERQLRALEKQLEQLRGKNV